MATEQEAPALARGKRLQGRLSAGSWASPALAEWCRAWLDPDLFDAIVEERALRGLCGNPACGGRPARGGPEPEAEKLLVVRRNGEGEAKTLETLERGDVRRFCGLRCYREAAALAASIPQDLVAFRPLGPAVDPWEAPEERRRFGNPVVDELLARALGAMGTGDGAVAVVAPCQTLGETSLELTGADGMPKEVPTDAETPVPEVRPKPAPRAVAEALKRVRFGDAQVQIFVGSDTSESVLALPRRAGPGEETGDLVPPPPPPRRSSLARSRFSPHRTGKGKRAVLRPSTPEGSSEATGGGTITPEAALAPHMAPLASMGGVSYDMHGAGADATSAMQPSVFKGPVVERRGAEAFCLTLAEEAHPEAMEAEPMSRPRSINSGIMPPSPVHPGVFAPLLAGVRPHLHEDDVWSTTSDLSSTIGTLDGSELSAMLAPEAAAQLSSRLQDIDEADVETASAEAASLATVGSAASTIESTDFLANHRPPFPPILEADAGLLSGHVIDHAGLAAALAVAPAVLHPPPAAPGWKDGDGEAGLGSDTESIAISSLSSSSLSDRPETPPFSDAADLLEAPEGAAEASLSPTSREPFAGAGPLAYPTPKVAASSRAPLSDVLASAANGEEKVAILSSHSSAPAAAATVAAPSSPPRAGETDSADADDSFFADVDAGTEARGYDDGFAVQLATSDDAEGSALPPQDAQSRVVRVLDAMCTLMTPALTQILAHGTPAGRHPDLPTLDVAPVEADEPRDAEALDAADAPRVVSLTKRARKNSTIKMISLACRQSRKRVVQQTVAEVSVLPRSLSGSGSNGNDGGSDGGNGSGSGGDGDDTGGNLRGKARAAWTRSTCANVLPEVERRIYIALEDADYDVPLPALGRRDWRLMACALLCATLRNMLRYDDLVEVREGHPEVTMRALYSAMLHGIDKLVLADDLAPPSPAPREGEDVTSEDATVSFRSKVSVLCGVLKEYEET